ncbi:MAG: hypothetical protein ACOC9P_00095 [bacterium]
MKRIMTFCLLFAAAGVLIMATAASAQENDPHSAQGCAACHTPHNAYDEDTSVPLWTRTQSTWDGTDEESRTETDIIDLSTYDSDFMDATDAGNEVSGASILCLSCHDGSHGGPDRGFGESGNLGALSHSHPLGIVYDSALATADGELEDPTTLEDGVLDATGRVGCQSCHDVHVQRETATSGGEKYLRWAYLDDYDYHENPDGDRLSDDFCNNCHIK